MKRFGIVLMLQNKIIPYSEIAELSQKLHQQGKKIVFTNGCFDILHCGHILYLEKAKALGDILILGLNSDASVKRLKGNNRPIVSEKERALVVAGLESVDYVCIFAQDTPYELIDLIQPDVLVKGGDWTIDKIVGADIVQKKGGKVLSLNYEQGFSTTNIIERIKQDK
ncbi:Glycerol-3-phosphate cytidyltransferase [Candidatus Cloacimonas acidaminovorans str. Evry]|uniref:D-glycero-beta-D-manno-heptose 1-phosphate adenylyltransferase n=2 Tax=Candidatus Cloacimonas TaxID=456826 RepID=B0VG54_CLOAI|nr:Glycerol-3-phosphate cytidyltransferase [Candidatus Cloacimonas acidaminovorans str. Evry]